MIGLVIIVIVTIFVYFFLFRSEPERHELLAKHFVDKKWCTGEEVQDFTIRPFEIKISDKEISDLEYRLDNARMPTPSLEGTFSRLGLRIKSMEELIKYWRYDYSWRNAENELNQYDHFKTKIEGLDIHFLHIKPKNIPHGITPRPLMLIHGWPGSFYEFYKVIPMLLDPLHHGGNESDIFELVIPSIPGYGFSSAPEVPGLTCLDCARIFHKLMLRLEIKEYFLQGGDWGSEISVCIAKLYPSCIRGIHTNFLFARFTPKVVAKIFFGSFAPSLFYHPVECNSLFPFLRKFINAALIQSGYMHIQATKPDSISYALTDSPTGLAAYIIEKFVAWTNPKFPEQNDLSGLYKYFTKDDLLTNVMIYWWTGNIGATMTFYYNNFKEVVNIRAIANLQVTPYAGFAMHPHEFIPCAKDWVEGKFPNLISMTYMNDGGHFGAFQLPRPFVEDLRQFVNKVENTVNKNKLLEEQTKQELSATSSHLDVLKKN